MKFSGGLWFLHSFGPLIIMCGEEASLYSGSSPCLGIQMHPFCNGEVSLEHGSRSSLVAGKAKVGSGPFHRQMQCISFPLE